MASTFDLARATALWANEVDPSLINVRAEDLQALCGQSHQKKLLAWCQSSLRNKNNIRAILRNRHQQAQQQKVEELGRLRMEKDARLAELETLLSKQRELKCSVKKALGSIRKIEGKADRASDEFSAQLTRHQISLQLAEKRQKDLKMWADTFLELCNDAPFHELENNIVDMKRISSEALTTASSAVAAHRAEKTTNSTTELAKDPQNSHDVNDLLTAGTYKQTEAELQAHILREYLTACTVMNSVNSKRAEKLVVVEEAKDHFRNALAMEVGLAEKNCLRTLMTEIEGAVLQVSSGPAELQLQKDRSQHLNAHVAKLKKLIASQARKNVQLDRRLEEINGFIFDGAPLPTQASSSTLVLDESAIHYHSSLHPDSSHVHSHGPRHVTTYEEAELEAGGGSLGVVLDGEVEEFGRAVAAVGGCWLAQSQVLARLPASALKRIVPERSAVHFDPADAPGTVVSLPVPVEDYVTRQAVDGTSLFRLLSTELGVPPSLSAQASLEAAAAIGENASRFHANSSGVLARLGDDVAPSSAAGGLTYTQVVAELCAATETLQHYAGFAATGTATATATATANSAAIGDTGDAGDKVDTHAHPPGEVADTLVHALGAIAEHLKDCLGDASTLKASFAALHAEESLTGIALRDYDERPAEHLMQG